MKIKSLVEGVYTNANLFGGPLEIL